MRKKQELVDIISNHYKPPFNELLVNEIRHSIRLKTVRNTKIEIAKTKFGGVPHLPECIKWPLNREGNEYLTFFGQINCREIKNYDLDDKLPNEGMLYFFYDWENWNDGCVIYLKEIENIKHSKAPKELTIEKKTFFQKIFNLKGIKLLLPECGVDFFNEYNIISKESLQFEKLKREKNISQIPNNIMEEEVYENEMLYSGEDNSLTPNHHLLGIYNGIHNEYCQLEILKNRTKINKLSLGKIKEALKWKLLLQFDTDENLDFMLADSGKVYFFIHEDDLKKQNFNNVKVFGDTY